MEVTRDKKEKKDLFPFAILSPQLSAQEWGGRGIDNFWLGLKFDLEKKCWDCNVYWMKESQVAESHSHITVQNTVHLRKMSQSIADAQGLLGGVG